ncbi:MAG: cysteine hydrolase [Desulfobacterales bacterium]|nr:cysteine hydrolase [Desulfobacterales bacterium]
MNTALLSIDIQNDYFPGGRMALEGSVAAGRKAGQILSLFREKGLALVHIQHLSTRPDATFFIAGTDGVQIHADVQPVAGEPVIQKHYPNAFRETQLLAHLRSQQIEHVVIAGMMTHMCVDATTRAAFDHGFRCTVLHDACATRTLAFGNVTVPAMQVHAAFLAALGAVYAKIADTDGFCASLG